MAKMTFSKEHCWLNCKMKMLYVSMNCCAVSLILVVKCYDCLVLVELFVIDFVRESLFHRKTLCSSNMKSTAKSQLYYVFAIACLLKILTNLLPNTVHKEGGWLLFDLDPGFPAFTEVE